MDTNVIEDEIYSFNALFFQEIEGIVNENLDFIEINKLNVPKENYTIVTDFLLKTLKKFRVLDSKSMSDTLKKLAYDIELLQSKNILLEEYIKNIKDIFKNKFLITSPLLSSLAKNLVRLKRLEDKTDEDEQEIDYISSDFAQLKKIYYELFYEIFLEDIDTFREGLLTSLNSKAFYFDKILWIEAAKSIVITKHFQVLKLSNKLNTKDYLLYTTELMRPYTKEYKYLQSCLRIYK